MVFFVITVFVTFMVTIVTLASFLLRFFTDLKATSGVGILALCKSTGKGIERMLNLLAEEKELDLQQKRLDQKRAEHLLHMNTLRTTEK